MLQDGWSENLFTTLSYQLVSCHNCEGDNHSVTDAKNTMLIVRPSPAVRYVNMQDLVDITTSPTELISNECKYCSANMTQTTEVLTTPEYLFCTVSR